MATKHFADSEFRCKDGCGVQPRMTVLQRRLERLRDLLGDRPIRIVSGYRCPPHNDAVGGATRSRHTTGEAADIPAALGVTVDMAKAAGFTGIGKKRNVVIHVDVRKGPVTVWNY